MAHISYVNQSYPISTQKFTTILCANRLGRPAPIRENRLNLLITAQITAHTAPESKWQS